jgi:hypothetical protein
MPDLVTVSELADLVARGARSSQSLILRRLRHWTLVDVLSPKGERHTGVGHHREYERETVYLAALLNELADMGAPLGVVKQASDSIRKLASGKRAAPVVLAGSHVKGAGLAGAGELPKDTESPVDLWRAAIDGSRRVFAIFSGTVGDKPDEQPRFLVAGLVTARVLALIVGRDDIGPLRGLTVINLAEVFKNIPRT